jgi:hypothetical protein
VIHAVQVNPADLFAVSIRVHDARSQTPCNEGQVGIRVTRLDRSLRRIEIAAPLEAIVRITGTFREEGAEGVDVSGDPLFAQPRRKAAVKEAGSSVKRPIEAVRESAKSLVFGGKMGAQIDDVESRLWG